MKKREFVLYRNFFILGGCVFIGLGASYPFRSWPGGPRQMFLVIVCTISLVVGGLMQFRLARVLHRRAQSASA
ncbi:MAG: hypothetical protein ACRD9R_13150 [Pyrinomonadaceae bacterium]